MEVKMKVAFLCCVLLLAGSASCSPVEANSISLPIEIPSLPIEITDWILDLIADLELPDAIQNIIDRLPEIIAAIPDIIDRIEEIVGQIIDKIPEVIPIIIDKLPEIIAQIPALVERIREILETIIDRIPELIPIILEKIPEIIEAIPGIVNRIKEIYDKIREKLEELDLPDWFPTLPDLDKPQWWPEGIPELPEYNRPTPGTPTSVSEYPGIVQIEVGTGPIWVQGCAGNILNNLIVLTSARCVSGRGYNPRFRRVRAGSSTRYDGGIISAVANAVSHPDFGSGDNFDADIALIKLVTFLVLGGNIQQIPIIPQDFVLPNGVGVTAVGWGSTAQGKLISDRDLYSIDLVTIDNESCADRWRLVPLLPITDNMICVGDALYGGRNGDVRDLGAPVLYQGILTGVQSWSAPVGNQYFPVVTTRVASYTNWIVANAV